jgi:hypothetical protein
VLHLLPEADSVLEEAKGLARDMAAARLAPLTRKQAGRLVTLLGRFVTAA